MTATIYDVAERAGVSISTVSLALNQPSRVAEATRERVLTAIDDLGFVPKATAVERARQSLSRIGVLAPFTTYASFLERLSGVLEVAGSQDLEVVVFDAESAATTSSPLVSTLPITGRLDAMIVMSLPLSDEAVQRLRRAGLPVVLVDSDQNDFTAIGTDDEGGGYQAGRRLIEGGKTRLVFVSEVPNARRIKKQKVVDLSGTPLSDEYVSQADRRIAGLRRAARDAGLGDDAVTVLGTANDIDGGAQAMRHLLADPTPVGVFAHHDLLAAGVLQEARAHGCSIPGDVAVIGFDDGDVARSIGLTTVRQPLRHSGSIAAATILELLADPTTPSRRVTLNVELVVRDSA